MAIPDSSVAKPELRRRLRQALRTHAADPADVRTTLDLWLAGRPSLRTIAIYSPLPGEVPLSAVVLELPQRYWAYPRVTGEFLTFHRVADPAAELLPGAFGILEPAGDAPKIPAAGIDAFICPGLAFDRRGGRLGRGRGFYDRLLANARPDAVKIGVCFPFQLVASTFPEPHDIAMNLVIAGTEVIAC